MFNALIGWITRGKIISFVLSCAVILSLGFTIPLAAVTKTDKTGKIKSGKSAKPSNGRGKVGEWNIVNAFTTPVVASHVHVLPDGRVLAWGPNLGGTNSTPNQTIVQIWDPAANCSSPQTPPTPQSPPLPPPSTPQCLQAMILPSAYENLYCAGHSFLPDGKLLITGGTAAPGNGNPSNAYGIKKAALFDYATGAWTQLPEMNDRRWYPTNLAMPDGSSLVWGGQAVQSIINPVSQVLEKQPDGTYTWRALNLKNPEPHFQYYSWVNMLSSGKALVTLGVNGTSYLLTVGGSYRYPKDFQYKYPFHATNSNLDGQLSGGDHHAGSQIVYDKDQMVVIGGSWDLPKSTVETINLNDSNPQWKIVAPLSIGRRHHNSTILPTGKVLVTGGNKGNAFNNTCSQHAVKEAEMWTPGDPGAWETLASAAEARIYHSAAVLLPDGRVMTGGTTAFEGNGTPTYPASEDPPPLCPAISDNYKIEIFSPPYLFNADGTEATRPQISNAPAQASYGQTIQFTVTNAGSGSNVSLVRLPSVTHSFNQNQGFNKLVTTISGQNFSVTIPANRNELVPGHYMMFVVNGSGVPSKAKIIQVL
jgi:hypothetical protein